MQSPRAPEQASIHRARKLNPAAIATLLGLVVLVLGSSIVIVRSLLPQQVTLPKNLEAYSKSPAGPIISNDPVELAFGKDKPNWNMEDFDVEATVNNPSVYKDVSKEEARKINLSMPFAAEISPAAAPFFIAGTPQLDAARAQHCLSLAVYYEAGSEPILGQYGVAQVVLNRVRHPAWPHSVCGVVFQGSERRTGCQFTFTCDGALSRKPTGRAWQVAQGVASASLNGFVMPEVGHATHYHTDWVAPYWAPTLRKLKQIGTHIFYTWTGGGGNPSAFGVRYEGKEAWPKLAALTAPQLGLADMEQVVVEEASILMATCPVSGDALPMAGVGPATGAGQKSFGTSAGRGGPGSGTYAANPNLSARLESEAARAATGTGDAIRTPAPLPKPGPNGLMPEPDLETLLPKYQVPTELPKRPTFVVPTPSEQKRQEQRGRAMDGL
jgi:spore germination cell wall hydrolase CwlJ-like protein